MDRYLKIEKLGEGTYGVVYKAQQKQTGEIVALKRIRLDHSDDDEGIPSTAIREISLLKHLKHPNIIRLLDVLHSEKKLTLVFEHMETDLKRFMDARIDKKGRGENTFYVDNKELIKGFIYQLIRGVAFCHANLILHRDLKPQNLLVSKRGELCIADFGLARPFGAPSRIYNNEVVTLWYRSPDVLLGSVLYSTNVDIWSIGCIMAELVRGTPLFPGADPQDQLRKIFKCLGTPNLSTWPGVEELEGWKKRDVLFETWAQEYKAIPFESLFPMLEPAGRELLSRLLAYPPEHRIPAHEALRHPYFADTRHKYNDLELDSSSSSEAESYSSSEESYHDEEEEQ